MRRTSTALLFALALGGCATLGLGGLVQPPRFQSADDRGSYFRMLPPNAGMPYGGVSLRVWTRVSNPNSFGLNLTSLAGDLYLDNSRTATFDLPMGLPLLAAQDTVVPVDIEVDLQDVPRIARVLENAVGTGSVRYRMDGKVGVSTPTFGYQEFGPATIVSGAAPVRVF